ncbi:MAG TPA: hypothetical protein VML92_02735 [Steroidobacteraceae bacterium]|nr:hypothetical protein [Steroidobacteraceae bacterium]
MNKKTRTAIWTCLWMCLVAASAGAQGVAATTGDGLIEVKPGRMDAAFLMPGADVLRLRAGVVDLYIAAPDT